MEKFIKPSIPKSTSACVIIPPDGQTFITGLAYSYREDFPQQLQGVINYEHYKDNIIVLNESIQNFWPCFCAQYGIGYTCCLCTLGLSLLIPKLCIKEAEEAAERQIDYMNRTMFEDKGLRIKIRKKCNNSWLEISKFNKSYLGTNEEIDSDMQEQEKFVEIQLNQQTSVSREMEKQVFS